LTKRRNASGSKTQQSPQGAGSCRTKREKLKHQQEFLGGVLGVLTVLLVLILMVMQYRH
jgi:hypothetical protein